jgi:hypothetical protein
MKSTQPEQIRAARRQFAKTMRAHGLPTHEVKTCLRIRYRSLPDTPPAIGC